jgi:hypothetical protein
MTDVNLKGVRRGVFLAISLLKDFSQKMGCSPDQIPPPPHPEGTSKRIYTMKCHVCPFLSPHRISAGVVARGGGVTPYNYAPCAFSLKIIDPLTADCMY